MTPSLGAFELTVLLAVIRLGEDAYGLSVQRDVSERTGHDYSVGAIYTTLRRLEAKKFVTTRTSEPVPVRGGRSRTHFRVTAAGLRAVRHAQEVSASVWEGLRRTLGST